MTDYQNLKNCWAKIKAEKGPDDLAYNFYQTLFNAHPETQALFPNDILAQKRTLLSTIDNIINGIDHLHQMKDELLELGRHHKNLGVTKEMYEVFIVAIIGAADFASNSSLTQPERIAWEEAFREMADLMLEAY